MGSSPFEFQIRRLPGNESNYLLIRESRQRYFFRERVACTRAEGGRGEKSMGVFSSARMKCAINPSRVATSATETALISPPLAPLFRDVVAVSFLCHVFRDVTRRT